MVTSVQFCLLFIMLFKIPDISVSSIDDYWSDDFDTSKNCENKGRCLNMPVLLPCIMNTSFLAGLWPAQKVLYHNNLYYNGVCVRACVTDFFCRF